MGIRNERRTWRLLNFEKWPIWWALGIPLVAALIVGSLQLWFAEDISGVSGGAAISPFVSEPANASASPQVPNDGIDASTPVAAISPESKQKLEQMFAQLGENSEQNEKKLRDLKRALQETFAGQEDCWSCEGSAYFDRFDRIAGQGEARKPLGLRDWVEAGDEAFEAQNLAQARKYYSSALDVMDERAFQEDENVDQTALDRVRARCQQLKCQ